MLYANCNIDTWALYDYSLRTLNEEHAFKTLNKNCMRLKIMNKTKAHIY
mgnify:CR=1 FL=1